MMLRTWRNALLSAVSLFGVSIGGCSMLMAAPPSPFASWTLQAITGPQQSIEVADPDVSFTLTLDDKLQANGKVACNGWHGRATLDGAQFQLKNAASTRMRCVIGNETLRTLEKRYLRSLQAPSQLQVTDARLQLTFANGEVWTFTRATP